MTFEDRYGLKPPAGTPAWTLWLTQRAAWGHAQEAMREKIAVAAEQLADIAPVSAPILARLARAQTIE